MSEFTTRRISPRRRQTDLVCKVAFAGAVAFGLGLVLVEALSDGDPQGGARPFEIVTGACAIVAFMVGVLSAAVGAVAFPSRGYWAPRDNPLPAWGHRARILSRVGIRLFWVVLVVSIVTTAVVTLARSLDLMSKSAGDGVAMVIAAVGQGAIALMVLAGVVWLAAELVAGFRDRRPQRHTKWAP